ncbi:MAG: flotillin family protein [bacterium]
MLEALGGPYVVMGAVAIVLVIFFGAIIYARRYVKVGPNTVLVISGRKRALKDPDGSKRTVGFRVVKGGGAFVWPIIERSDLLSLELITLDVTTPEVYTKYGVAVIVDGVAQIKVKGDDISIATASEQFLSKSQPEMARIAIQTVEGHLRAILGTLTVEEAYSNRDAFAQKVQEVASSDLANMGLTIVSFTIRDIRDKTGYLEALGKPRIAQVKRDAVIGEAEATRDATIRSAEANRDGQSAKFAADTKIAEAQRDYQMRVAEYTASVNQKKAEADLSYDLQKFKTNQSVKREEVQVQVVEKEMSINVQEKEIERKRKELTAMIEKPADAERYKVETLANAEKYRLQTTAVGQADYTKATGFAQADVVKATGLAEADANKARGLAQADVIKAQGFSEAEANKKKAEAWQAYNEAAIAQILIERLPDIAKAIAEPLTKTEKIVIVNAGGDSAGASKVTKDVANIVSQLPPVVEALSGVKLDELVKKIPGLQAPEEKKK